jgi:hypothetical protein
LKKYFWKGRLQRDFVEKHVSRKYGSFIEKQFIAMESFGNICTRIFLYVRANGKKRGLCQPRRHLYPREENFEINIIFCLETVEEFDEDGEEKSEKDEKKDEANKKSK